jgi:hypothetical protein
VKKFDHRFMGFERAMQAAFFDILHALREGAIYNTPLPRRVLTVG